MNVVNSEHRQVIIIGAGSAGLTGAIYAARANLNPLVIRGPEPGGQLATTTEVENYPGFVNGILGPELMQHFEAQASRFGAELRYGMITSVDFSQRPFQLFFDHEKTLLADAVIVATGASPNYLGLDNEKRLLGHGVSSCATCDAAFFRGREVAIVGGGDTAIEDAIFLTRFCAKVYVIHRRDRLRAAKILQARAFAKEKIGFIWNTLVEDILGENEVEAVLLKNIETQEIHTLPLAGLFVAIGYRPNTKIFQGWLDMDSKGYIRTVCGSTHTNIAGVFASGDAQDYVYRQAATAVGTGCMAAIDAERWLESQYQVSVSRGDKWGKLADSQE
ncbi:thioredoxin-disulfide reductase [Umezakia ovalisporum]|uniref:Thioredoxin reductase n=1 Tax=Umezakia ovalisporum FSS-62 TaxID=2971776 RepID=A0AA43GY53_9CYAN|nr:thioredoxin-disulfide reductase [Umezakia ovalisporum]MDH6062988.1 thioredoxin-disulfide reductase [Umezakia ovalisporum FSS-62]MDH6075902.1 thioredoxin-disulfide reductase [Umezakia ovalisporum CS-1034]